MQPYAVEFQNVSRVFGQEPHLIHALNGIDLQVEPGELVAVMGPSGSGKSTLLNIAGLLQRPTSGQVLIQGMRADELSDAQAAKLRREHIGIVFQRFNLVSTFTIGENVALPLELGGQQYKELRPLVEEALAAVQLHDMIDRFPEEISGGQAQRVAIARALIGNRKLILADEPTGALDTATSDEVMRILRAQIDKGAAGILVTHEARFAGYADRVIYVRDGRITS